MGFIYSGFEAMPRDEANRFPMSTRAATYILARNRTCLCQNDTQWLPEWPWAARRIRCRRPRQRGKCGWDRTIQSSLSASTCTTVKTPLVEDNVVDLLNAYPIRHHLCTTRRYFNNTNSAGQLIQGGLEEPAGSG